MKISRNGARPSVPGSPDYFTGRVRVDSLFLPAEPSRVAAASVTFEPGARTAWHTHPLGQHLIVVSGVGWAQCEGEPIEEIGPGDVIWFPPGVRHWHGASATKAMTHLAVQEQLDGTTVTWLEPVVDEDYLQAQVGS